MLQGPGSRGILACEGPLHPSLNSAFGEVTLQIWDEPQWEYLHHGRNETQPGPPPTPHHCYNLLIHWYTVTIYTTHPLSLQCTLFFHFPPIPFCFPLGIASLFQPWVKPDLTTVFTYRLSLNNHTSNRYYYNLLKRQRKVPREVEKKKKKSISEFTPRQHMQISWGLCRKTSTPVPLGEPSEHPGVEPSSLCCDEWSPVRGRDTGAGSSGYANEVINKLLISISRNKVMSHTVDSCLWIKSPTKSCCEMWYRKQVTNFTSLGPRIQATSHVCTQICLSPLLLMKPVFPK